MKKFTAMMTAVALLCGSAAQAQQTPAPKSTGRAAASSRSSSSGWVALGIGLSGLAVLGVVVGLTAASAASSPSTFSH
jgi:hypothetical protein